jgi:hypothetical protein
MKQIVTAGCILILALLLIAPSVSVAQTSDILVVYATPKNINQVINGDTLANGTRKHHVYQLVSLDTTYVYDGAITSKEDISVLGVVHPTTKRPPCIQPVPLQDGTIPGNLFILGNSGIKGTFKNLYMLALATNNTANAAGVALQVSANNVSLTVDNCVFDGWLGFAIGYNGNWDKFFVTNSNFRNMVHPNQWYVGEVLRNEWPGEVYTDTVSFKYNTMTCINGYAAAPVTKYYTRYFEFVGNKVIYTFKNPFFIFNITNAKINDNIFYGMYAGGVDQTEHPWWDNLWEPDSTYGVIALEALNTANAKMFLPGDSANVNIAMLAEARRTIEVKNNKYFWPSALTTFWTSYNANTANTNKIRTPMWMNTPTVAMFNNKSKWPGLVQSGNQNTDPGYGTALNAALNGTTGNDIGLLAYFTEVRKGTAATNVWGLFRTQVGTALNWTPTWPLPEVATIQPPSVTSDDLDVYATPKNLNAIINADTLANGARKHHVYRLVSLDTTYVYDGAITSKEDITVLGVVHPTTKRPPCIQPVPLQDGTIPGNLFILNGAGTKGTFKNLYMLALATNNTANAAGVALQVSANNISLTVDNCVFDGWLGFAIGYNGNWDDFFVTNSNFRNMVHPNQWYVGEVLRNEWPGEAYTNTISFKNNVMTCINGYAAAPVTKYYTRYFEFVGNKVIYTFKNPFFIFNVTNAKINDNIFYGMYAGGVDKTEHPWWDNLWEPDSTYGVIALEALSTANAKMFLPGDSTRADLATYAESRRTVEVKNNKYFWPSALTSFWTSYNANTANTNKIRTPMWMNDPTTAMFNNKTKWPGLVQSGNQSLDPGYGTSLNAALNGTTGNDIGLLAYFMEVRKGTAATNVWGLFRTQVGTALNWKPTWPLQESAILSSVERVASETIPVAFNLSPVYPNPFNPSTTVEYTLNKAGLTSLRVYNLLGQQVLTVIDNVYLTPSAYRTKVDMSFFTSGVYFCVLEQGGNRLVQKMVLLK